MAWYCGKLFKTVPPADWMKSSRLVVTVALMSTQTRLSASLGTATRRLVTPRATGWPRLSAFTGQWWLDARKPKLEEVAANLIDLAWNGLSHLDAHDRESARA